MDRSEPFFLPSFLPSQIESRVEIFVIPSNDSLLAPSVLFRTYSCNRFLCDDNAIRRMHGRSANAVYLDIGVRELFPQYLARPLDSCCSRSPVAVAYRKIDSPRVPSFNYLRICLRLFYPSHLSLLNRIQGEPCCW